MDLLGGPDGKILAPGHGAQTEHSEVAANWPKVIIFTRTQSILVNKYLIILLVSLILLECCELV